MVFRKITSADEEIYLDMANEFYSSPAVAHSVAPANFAATFNELMRSDEYAVCYIFEENSKVVGYALLAITFSQEAGGKTVWLEEIYIRPEFRGKGAGGAFLDFIRQQIPAFRYRLEIEPDNEKAAALYSRHGFEELGYKQMIIDTKAM